MLNPSEIKFVDNPHGVDLEDTLRLVGNPLDLASEGDLIILAVSQTPLPDNYDEPTAVGVSQDAKTFRLSHAL